MLAPCRDAAASNFVFTVCNALSRANDFEPHYTHRREKDIRGELVRIGRLMCCIILGWRFRRWDLFNDVDEILYAVFRLSWPMSILHEDLAFSRDKAYSCGTSNTESMAARAPAIVSHLV